MQLPSALISFFLTLHLIILTIAQRPPPPPDACYRRNDSLPACPYGGDCNPSAGYMCQRSCVNYQHIDARFWCSVPCGYDATTLSGIVAPNPLLCLQPTTRNGLSCGSGWACYRRFGRTPPLFQTAGPACSPRYDGCDILRESKVGLNETSRCGTGRSCVLDPRWRLARPFVPEDFERRGICVSNANRCEGKKWDECGEGAECVKESTCKGKLGADCKGTCVQLLDPMRQSWNSTRLVKRYESRMMC